MKPDAFGYHWWYKTVTPVNRALDSDVLTPLHPDVEQAREEACRRRQDQITASIIRAVQRAFE